MSLFVLAAGIRLLAAAQMPFPATEPSAYYLGVAENLVQGHGLVSDALWSYATPPLVVPKPAFELWMPMSSFVSAIMMAILGTSFWSAQVGASLLGAMAAPLAWVVAREAARVQGLDERRGSAVALASGLIIALLAPTLLASAVPDSYTPYLVFTLLAAVMVPRVLGAVEQRASASHRLRMPVAGSVLGASMGLAYLSRQEAIWLGLSMLLMLGWALRSHAPSARLAEAARRLGPVVLGGLLVVLPWLLRNHIELGSPFPGQAIENAFLVRNEDIFAFAQRPTLATYLEQGLPAVLSNPLEAAWHALVDVIVLPAFPVGILGLAALVALRHAPALRRPTALATLVLSGGLTLVTTLLLFPVASRWGTFAHASGPLIVALTVLAVLGGDALLARVSRVRRWERPNIIIAPIALLAMSLLMAVFQVGVLAQQSHASEARVEAVAESLERYAADHDLDIPPTIITDRPMWLATAMRRGAVVLPHEDLDAVLGVSRHFGTPWVAVLEAGDRYPGRLLAATARDCLAQEPVPLGQGPASAWLFVLDGECTRS